MDDLVAFLRARLDERAARAEMAAADAGEAEWRYDPNGWLRTAHDQGGAVAHGAHDFLGPKVGAFMADNDPARALAEVEVQRDLLRVAEAAHDFAPTFTTGFAAMLANTLRLLAAAYAEHPDYRPEWAPDA